ncbi:hypothetical protein EX30DRAFT_173429 [Ascodesmis nigricans]|uniref:Uncharacterized protein n=1 Tax=Ascodesmis nigricans TaxID=341454 RepID=A0A4V6RHB8_9PEZI|nr:hypothetical protein EX30DRAFT_173429 [Ascodesmis nigricans]
MPGLHPLQNALPSRVIPNEAPAFFHPFFEQRPHPPPVSIWQPPEVDTKPPRSKAATIRTRTPPTILSAGTWSRKSSKDVQEQKTGLFKPKDKTSGDEIMWLGAVTGFEIKEEPRSMRSKLVRKPETIASQASAAVGPKAMEQRQRKLEEEHAREERLLKAWATKRKPAAETSKPAASGPTAPATPLPQPIESRLRPRRRIGMPLVKASDVSDTSTRPSMIHRPHMPARDNNSFAPEKPFLPQPIEVKRRSHRPVEKKKKGEEEEGMLWMGPPQPFETSSRSHRKSPSEADGALWMGLPTPYETVRRSNRKRPELPSAEKPGVSQRPEKEILPEPIESSFRSNRSKKPEPKDGPKGDTSLPQPIETSRKSNRPAGDKPKEILLTPFETTHTSNRPTREILPQPIETSRRTNRPAAIEPVKEILPEPIETTRRSNRPEASSEKATSPPPTPTPRTPLPQPYETVKRSYRPLIARPLIPQSIEASMRSTRTRIPRTHDQVGLPQPVLVSRHTNRSPFLRGDPKENTRSGPLSPGLYGNTHFRRGNRPKPLENITPPSDHVWHLHEPIDSAPPSPNQMPQRVCSPPVSQCPSLSSSPASTATSSAAWDAPARGAKKWGTHDQRNSFDDDYSDYAAELEHKLKAVGALGTPGRLSERSKEESEYPFPITEDKASADADRRKDQPQWAMRNGSSETIRPSLRALNTQPIIQGIDDETHRQDPETDDYPICRSPVFENFPRPRPPPTPAPESQLHPLQKQKPGRSNVSPADASAKMSPSVTVTVTQTRLPTPPDSNHPSLSSFHTSKAQPLHLSLSASPHPQPVARPSPGYTVASLPPTNRSANTAKEVTPEFIDEVYRYLSLQYENIAWKFDEELASYTGWPVEVVKRDRKGALGKYCERFVGENPHIATGEQSKGGLW